ncbi:MAG: transporter substrate-binding domain-containing protein, partial [Rhodospirillaceae bacterium]|nr:transporter substrate-binding domain-containing protein [Rhodospirillaceae bacterium]
MEIYTELGLTNTQNIGGEFFYAPKKSAEFLTDAETAWLRKHPKIRVHNETNWPPFNFAKDGQAMGFSIDYMNLVASKVGLKVDYITGPTWSEFLGMMKSGKLDVMLNIVQTPERLEYLLYTKPYASNPNTILSRKDTPYTSLEELAGKTVAVPKGFYQEEILKRDFPQIKLHLVDDVLGGMKAVSFGQADATVGEFAIFNHLIESELMTGLFMSGELKMGATGLEKLWIATRKDLPVLRSILTKAMTAVSRGEKQKLVSRWIASASSEPKQPADTSSAETSKTVLFFLISIFGLLAAFGVIGIILKRSMGNRDISTFFGAPGFRISIMAGLSLLVAVVAIMNWLAISDSKERVVKGIGEELQIVLSSSIERLNIWVSQKQAFLRQLGKDRELVKITQELLKADRESSSLGRSLAVREARAFFTSNEQFGSTGFFIIAPDKINIGARENASLGTLNLIAEKHLGLIEKAFKGETVFVPPIRYDVKRGAGATVSAKNQPLTMFIATPIIDENGSVLAVLAEHIPSHGALSRILQFGRVGKSGETYAFNGEAKMVSESRFKDDLVALGLISNQSKIGAELDIRDPGGNMTQGYQPNTDPADRSMTKMIVGALKLRNSKTKTAQSEPSVNTGGYPDYRGVPVVGAWAWLHQLGLGVATEMDVEEAMADHAALRFNLIAISTVALVLAVGATLFTLLLGQRAHSSLTKARDELEDRVVERTLELANKEAQLRLAMDNMPGGMVLIDSEQNFLLFNQQYSELFDFPDDLIAEDRPILDMVS